MVASSHGKVRAWMFNETVSVTEWNKDLNGLSITLEYATSGLI